MRKFTDLNESIEQPKFFDKTKQEIYSLLKENMKDSDKMSQIDDETDFDELTDKLYNFVQKEKTKQEIVTLESMKTVLVAGPFNFQILNEQIDKLRKGIQ